MLAAGRGLRAGGRHPKQYARLGGVPLIRRTVEIFLNYRGKNGSQVKSVAPVIVVVNPADAVLYRQALGDLADKILLADGGATRQESTLNGLHLLKTQRPPPSYVHIHDGARPFVSHDLLDKIHAALAPIYGLVPVLPVAETLKRLDTQDFIAETVPRGRLYAAQTPQIFPFAAILAVHEQAAAAGRTDFTDDSALAEAYGLPVKSIAGDSRNIKITWEEDIAMADSLLQQSGQSEAAETKPLFPDIRTGNGYDVHRLGTGSGVVLCGVRIPCSLVLQGHSDADVALHALTDALLATCGAGDIGSHFPPSEQEWRGAASEIFVRRAAEIVAQKGGQIVNVDITLICEAPKIAPYRAAMAENLQTMLDLAAGRVSVKATTNETLGFIGRGEGIAAIATANVYYQ
ncbi:MAG: bifunctional 2-C-methyl-D-erythritol 4-phosphate cytidylyltransferase/2-C-methyl-D-erythritol 2,4-cyclodiphosphate synthase [Candidatus Tokpelaia sp.]|nr:MAG: bifunctional 2-C-methyl-D-erythritol 4-phosphate cytidylyltransferase/2-C-methyl-D-erythritol 2,4-cyclodiphosphate synthase [Candidatus Tokpelaia sp.]KAA6207747.1 MAG: bifunctional 2-C-methyl-D-erythritol 4-phosphate cytidylyltransferase/2-C-methyl-D-erythritol 2,4-cyclodiphosphate synthase [Candidatus Tokpelaia sp.]